MRELWWSVTDRLAEWRDNAERWVFAERRALFAVALARIGLGLSVLVLLGVNFTNRGMWVGEASVWAEPLRAVSAFPELALMRNATGNIVTVIYVVTMAAALALALGWRTRLANLLTLVGFIAIVGQNPMVGDSSDNVVRLALFWLFLTHSSAHFSLDQRRRNRRAAAARIAVGRSLDAEDVLPRWLGRSLHNIGLLGLMVQAMLLYLTAGLDKIADPAWRRGDALFFTSQLPEFRPFPALSDLLVASPVVLAFVTYSVLLVQLFFVPLLLNRASRIVVVTAAIVLSVFFAVLFGSVSSMLAVIAITVLFLPGDLLEDVVLGAGDRVVAISDRFLLLRYGIADAADWVRFSVVLPVADFVRFTVLRR